MLWQFAHVTSFSWCLPEVQNARLRLPEWQLMQTAVRSSAVWPGPNGFAGLAFIGSFRCSAALPWQVWHMLPLASLRAPWAERSIDFHCASWQLAQMGASLAGFCCWACAGAHRRAMAATTAPSTPRRNL